MIHLHTNGNSWTPKMWDSMSNVHDLVKWIEISIDLEQKKLMKR